MPQLKKVAHSDSINFTLGGITPLMAAAEARDNAGAACAQLLLELGADARIADAAGRSVMHCAAQSDSGELLQLLVDAGADVNVASNNGDTALTLSAECNSTEAAKALIRNKADLFIRNGRGLTAMQVAEAAGNESVLQLLADAEK